MIKIPAGTDSDLRSGIVSGFNKTLNEALQIGIKIRWFVSNRVNPSLLMGVLKGSFGTPGLVAAISAEKDNVGVKLAVSNATALRGKTIEFHSAQTTGSSQLILTVAKGKIFYITGCGITMHASVDNDVGNLYVGAAATAALCIVRSAITATYQTKSVETATLNFASPIPISGETAAQTINVVCGQASSQASGWIVGWEEDA